MTRFGILAAIPALAWCAPALAQVPPAPMPPTPPPGSSVPIPPYAAPAAPFAEISAPAGQRLRGDSLSEAPRVAVRTDPATGATIETIVLPPGTRPPPSGEGDGAVALTSTPDFVWVPGHYNWEPARQRYVWLVGQYLQAPRPDARWVDGHWRLAGTQYIWIAGHFD